MRNYVGAIINRPLATTMICGRLIIAPTVPPLCDLCVRQKPKVRTDMESAPTNSSFAGDFHIGKEKINYKMQVAKRDRAFLYLVTRVLCVRLNFQTRSNITHIALAIS